MITKRRHIVAGMIAIFMAGIMAMPASAKPAKWKDNPFKMQNNVSSSFAAPSQNLPQWAQRRISASEAKSIARSRVRGGEVVDISRNGDTYRVRVIRKDGRVVDVFIDANTGRVKR